MSDSESIHALAARLIARMQLLDALINNAGIYKAPARDVWAVNLLGPLLLTRALEPLLAPNARVVMVTSGLGELSAQPKDLVKRLSNPELTFADLERLAIEAPNGYGGSKAALNATTRLFAEQLKSRGIRVTAIDPGWVRTDMGGRNATRSVAEGAARVLSGLR